MALEQVIRPSAVLSEACAASVLRALNDQDVSRGGVWNATSSVWQRYDRAWNGLGGMRGTAQLIGSVAVIYDRPIRHQITIYKVTITSYGASKGISVDGLVDEALRSAGLTLSTCPRTQLADPPPADPFWQARVAV
ncbi:MAG: hypothetical protein QOI76_2225 [Frankiales bacterium]|nr:hypothetical protein [Frankiales bacterium]